MSQPTPVPCSKVFDRIPPIEKYERLALPLSDAEIAHAVRDLNLIIPDACMPGVIANLTLLAEHAGTLCNAASKDC